MANWTEFTTTIRLEKYIYIFSLPFEVTKETSLRWINHRILGTNYYLLKMNLTENDRCTFCYPETITYLQVGNATL